MNDAGAAGKNGSLEARIFTAPQGATIKWLGAPPEGAQFETWRQWVRELGGMKYEPDAGQWWCAVDVAVGDSLAVICRKGATIMVDIASRRVESIEVLAAQGFGPRTTIKSTRYDSFALSSRSVGLRDGWLRLYVVFDRPVDDVDRVWFNGIVIAAKQ